MALPSNSVPEPDLSNATTHDVVFAGGMHGHTFLVLRRSGKPTDHREWQDTVLMSPGEAVEIAFVADNPGDWMFNCRILEHQDGGMMTVLRVS